MVEALKDFKRKNRGRQPTSFIMSEDDFLTLTEGTGKDPVPGSDLRLFGIPVVQGEITHVE